MIVHVREILHSRPLVVKRSASKDVLDGDYVWVRAFGREFIGQVELVGPTTRRFPGGALDPPEGELEKVLRKATPAEVEALIERQKTAKHAVRRVSDEMTRNAALFPWGEPQGARNPLRLRGRLFVEELLGRLRGFRR
jgi:hypothetical protein